MNLETENRFVPLTKEKKDRSSPCGTNKSSFISGLKFISMNINSIKGKTLELLDFLDFHQPHVVAIQETKIDSSIATSEHFPDTCPPVFLYGPFHSKAVLLLWFLTVICSCCLYLYFGSAIMLVIYFVNFR